MGLNFLTPSLDLPLSMETALRHTLSVLVENKPGVLARISGLFSSRAYNIQSLTGTSSPTAGLIQMLPLGGVLLFAYSSNLSRTGKTWINHDLAEVRSHFAQFNSDHETYFINKMDTFALGRLSFNGVFTAINQFVSKVTGMNGDIIVVVRKA